MPAYKHPFPKLEGKAILSPMAGVTDVAYRALCKRYGAALTVTEFTSASAIVRGSERTKHMLATDSSERPVAVQLFGHSEDEVVEAALQVQGAFDIIDINCGCPAWKVVRCGAGSAMLEDIEMIASFVRRLVEATEVPITVKIRAGIDDKRINAIEVAKAVEAAGASAIAVHGRTQKQGYSGVSDWDLIAQVKRAVSIPVIGNGDIFTPEDCKRRLEESGVDYVLVARGAIGKPYLFTQIRDFLATGKYTTLSNAEQFALLAEYLELAREHDIPFAQVKMHAQSFTKGQPGGAKLRSALVACKGLDDLAMVCDAYAKELADAERN